MCSSRPMHFFLLLVLKDTGYVNMFCEKKKRRKKICSHGYQIAFM
nr:unnamed protein product [Callosobruchus chinensis]